MSSVKNLKNVQWQLTPDGRHVIDRCQTEIWKVQSELRAFGALFMNVTICQFNCEEMAGVGIALQRMSTKLSKISDKLSESITRREVADGK